MASNYQDRLFKLRERRNPTSFATDSITKLAAASHGFTTFQESYERLTEGAATKYALGCMAAVDQRYTEISFEEGNRVGKQITAKMPSTMPVEIKFQGSLALDVHIRASSDVDILVLASWFLTADASPQNGQINYTWNNGISPLAELRKLRNQCADLLRLSYPAVNVDTSKAKAIGMTGGSLARKIDVVPSHWHDTAAYQQAPHLDALRGVQILDNSIPQCMLNLPFMHIALINHKDRETQGNAKKAIRFLKCLSRDADQKIELTSYDIAALIYHMANSDLMISAWTPLQLLNRVELYLISLEQNVTKAFNLDTPDLTRKILNEPIKFVHLTLLRAELSALIKAIAFECNSMTRLYDSSPAILRKALEEKYIFA